MLIAVVKTHSKTKKELHQSTEASWE